MRLYVKLAFGLAVLTALSSCVQETHIKTVTFQVDMKSVDAFQTVGIRGDIQPLSWENTIELTDDDNDSIYNGTFEFDTASNQLNFKFVIDEQSFELEGKNNRYLPFEYIPENLTYSSMYDQENFKLNNNIP